MLHDKQRGLYGKYRIQRVTETGEPKPGHEDRNYFVLDVDHDPHAIAALMAYANSCNDDYPLLANDLRLWATEARMRRLEQQLETMKVEYNVKSAHNGEEHGN